LPLLAQNISASLLPFLDYAAIWTNNLKLAKLFPQYPQYDVLLLVYVKIKDYIYFFIHISTVYNTNNSVVLF